MTWQTALKKANSQIDLCVQIVRGCVRPWYGLTLKEWPSPIIPPVHMLYAAHESAKKRKGVWIAARDVLTNYPEISFTNLTAKLGDNEVAKYGKDPYDVRSHFWAAQQAFWAVRESVDKALRRYHFAEFDLLSVEDQTILLLLPRAVGIGCVRGLLRKSDRLSGHASLSGHTSDSIGLTPIIDIENWIARPDADTSPFDGGQDTEAVRLRFAWCSRMVRRSGECGIGGLPTFLSPPLPDPGNLAPLPKDFMKNMQAYSAKARREGPMKTGPWPTK